MTLKELREQLRCFPEYYEAVLVIEQNGVKIIASLKSVDQINYAKGVNLSGES
jgi:hypothetical protein